VIYILITLWNVNKGNMYLDNIYNAMKKTKKENDNWFKK
jgi:hypothetical protein